MRIARDVLERFTPLPADNRELRLLFDDVGLEVKHVEDEHGPPVFALELLANRGDHHCYHGVAREVCGRTGLQLKGVSTASISIDPAGWPLEVQTDKVFLYSATLLELVRTATDLHPTTLRPLEAAEIHPIHPPVDATNLVNLEIGQPTHVFDADKVDGSIIIRESTAGERAWPLFAPEHIELPEGTLVIADRSKILAIAGVIGCEDSKATPESTRILLESAAFDPVAVRKSSRALEIHTDSSARFERGSDPERVLVGVARVVEILERVGWQRDGGTSIIGSWTDPERQITLDCRAANAFLQSDLLPEEIADILDRYGFQSEIEDTGLRVRVPTWRLWDVEHPADLYEELAKSIGYNALPTEVPPIGLGTQPTPEERRRDRVEEVLLGAGFYECITDGFYGRGMRDLLGISEGHPLWDHVQTTNALDRGYGLLKNNCLAQAVTSVASNLNHRVEDIRFYEWTRTFHPRSGEGSPSSESAVLWGICTGQSTRTWKGGTAADVWFLKGVVAELGLELGLQFVTTNGKHPLCDQLHPGRSALITLDGQTVGLFGEVHPAVLRRAGIKRARPCYFEIRAEALLAPGSAPIFREPSLEQPMLRNLAFALPPRVEAEAIAAWIHASGPAWLERVQIEDLFGYETDGTAMRAITYSLRFSAGRTADEVNSLLEALVAAVDEQYGAAGVTQR